MDMVIFKKNSFICSYKGGLITTSYEDLYAIEYDKPLVRFRLRETTSSVMTTLCNLESQLNTSFIRVNRQIIVNMIFAKQIVCKPDGCWILLKGDLEYKISERKIKYVRLSFVEYS